jgi:hypothetical protein
VGRVDDARGFADWFGGAASEVPVESVTMDVRPGGVWRATMFAGPDRVTTCVSFQPEAVIEEAPGFLAPPVPPKAPI